MQRKSVLFLLCALALCLTLAYPVWSATSLDTAKKQLERDARSPVEMVWNLTTSTPSFIRGHFAGAIVAQKQFVSAEDAARRWISRYAVILGVADPIDELQLDRSETDPLGYQHLLFQQFYAGIPVHNAQIKVHLTANTQDLIAVSNSFVPNLKLADTTPTFTVEQASALAAQALPQGRLVTAPTLAIYVAQRQTSPVAHLAWFVERWDEARLINNVYVIDAQTGLVLEVWNRVQDARDRRIHNADNTQDLPGRLVRSEGDGPTGDPDTDKAYDYAGDTYDYYLNTFNRDSYDNAGAPMTATVHYDQNFLNAGYIASFKQIVYGDDMVSKDVTGHEWSHGVINTSANLAYRWQSGALNESFADVFGAMIDRDDWLIGEDLPEAILRGHPAIRSMADPTLLGQPGHTDQWSKRCDDNEGVHVNSGITNKAYYNIAQAIGKEKAEQIFYRALTVYLQASSTLEDARAAALQAAADLYGAGSPERDAVDTGLRAVGLNGSWQPSANECTCAVTAVMATEGIVTDRMTALNTIATLYRLRDERLTTTAMGEHYRVLYEQQSGAATRLLLRDPQLLADAGAILLAADPGIVELLEEAATAEQTILTAELLTQIQNFLHNLATADQTQPEGGVLAALINDEMQRVDWAKLEGMTFSEAWDLLNKTDSPTLYKLYLPFIQE